MKLLMMKGLPGSGKSTKAKELAREMQNTVRVNRDLLREMLHFGKWLPQNEEGIIETEKMLISYFMSVEGRNVIIDDTNLTPKHLALWHDFAEKLRHRGLVDLEFLVEEVKTPWNICIERDAGREKKVGPSVIMQMAMEHGMLEDDIHFVISDLDGTLADLNHRREYVRAKPKNWKKFYEEMPNDTLRKEIYDQVEGSLADARERIGRTFFIIVSARPENYRKETEAWLAKHGVDDYAALIMRRAGDYRDDTIVKRELLHRYFKDKSKIIKVYDDRPRVVRMWREEGIEVVDVGDGIDF